MIEKCPKDADLSPLRDLCFEKCGDYLCTRPAGHKGQHHAHDAAGKCLTKKRRKL